MSDPLSGVVLSSDVAATLPRMRFASTKFDGSLHYRFPVSVVERRDTMLAIWIHAGEQLESYRGVRRATSHYLGLYWTDRHYNVEALFHPDWRPKRYYVNIASPADWSDGTLRLIDLDLDLIMPAEAGEPMVDDEDEFEAHQVRWGYPPELVARCRQTCEAVADEMRRRTGLFDGRLFQWRPGQPLPDLD